jgi:hypothetical protein
MMPDGKFRAGIKGVSVLLRHQKDWFSTLPSKEAPKLRALKKVGFEHTSETVLIERQGTSSAIAETISLKNLTTLITFEPLIRFGELSINNKRASAIQAAFTLGGLNALFRDAFGMPPQSQDERRHFFRQGYDHFIKALAENDAELKDLPRGSDDFYFPGEG